MAPYPAATAGEGRRKLEGTLDFVYRQRLLILLCTAVAVAAAAAYAYTRAPSFVSYSLVRVDLDEQSRSANAEDLAVGEEDPFATNDRSIIAEVFLLQTSSTLRQRVAERLEALERRGQGEAEPAGAPGPVGDVTFDVADQAANAVLITAKSADPRQAALLATLYADEYVRLTEEAARRRLSAQRSLLEEWEEEQRQALLRLEAEQRARAASGALRDPRGEAGLVAMQISSLEAQRDQVQTDLQTRRASLRAAEADLAALEPQLAQRVASDDDQRLQDLQGQLTALRAERAQTERRYPDATQRDPRVEERLRQLDADIQRLEAEAERLSQRIIASGGLSGGGTGGASTLAYAAQLRQQVQEDRAVIDALEGQAARLDARIAQHYADLRRLPREAVAQASQQIAQAQLERERLYAEQTYQDAASRLRDVRVAEETTGGYARVIQGAEVPDEPTQIPPFRLLLLGAFVGLSLGFGLAFVRDKVDNRILKPEQLREWGYPVLATVPHLRPLVDQEFGGEDYVEAEGRRLSTGLVALLSPLSPAAEAYRHLRTNLLARPGATFPVKVVLVTSPGPGDGKTTTAANLAVALAQSGNRTALVDADLRRPSVHKVFGIPRSPGLIQHLQVGRDGRSGSEGEVSDLVAGVPEVSSVGMDNLFVVPAGEAAAMGDGAAPDAAPATTLGTAVTAGYLQWLREQFDFVVIDTPPLLAVTDALQLARQCDAVVVAVRAKQTREGELTHVLESLEQVGAPVVGTVLNGFEVAMAYGYKYRYRGYSEYGLYAEYGNEGEGAGSRKRKGKRRRHAEGQSLPTPSPGK